MNPPFLDQWSFVPSRHDAMPVTNDGIQPVKTLRQSTPLGTVVVIESIQCDATRFQIHTNSRCQWHSVMLSTRCEWCSGKRWSPKSRVHINRLVMLCATIARSFDNDYFFSRYRCADECWNYQEKRKICTTKRKEKHVNLFLLYLHSCQPLMKMLWDSVAECFCPPRQSPRVLQVKAAWCQRHLRPTPINSSL